MAWALRRSPQRSRRTAEHSPMTEIAFSWCTSLRELDRTTQPVGLHTSCNKLQLHGSDERAINNSEIGDRQKEGCSPPNAYVFRNTGVHKAKAICAALVSNSICSRRGLRRSPHRVHGTDGRLLSAHVRKHQD